MPLRRNLGEEQRPFVSAAYQQAVRPSLNVVGGDRVKRGKNGDFNLQFRDFVFNNRCKAWIVQRRADSAV